MAYKVEFDESEHLDIIKPMFENVLNEEPDIFIITDDGEIVETHKILLSLFSRYLASVLNVLPPGKGVPGLSVPAKAETVRMFVKLLEQGNVVFKGKEVDFEELTACGTMFGLNNLDFKMDNYTIMENRSNTNKNELDPVREEEWDFQTEQEEFTHIKTENILITEEGRTEEEPLSLKTLDQHSFPCTRCGRELRSLVKLKFHLERKHGISVKIEQKCPVCENFFKSRKKLSTHMIHHTNDKRYRCEFCEKRFYRNTHLKSHKLTHSKESLELADAVESRKVECSECGKVLRNQQCLKSHMINIHSMGKPHKCSECGKCFKMVNNMKIHRLTHIGRYACDLCKTRFHSKLEVRIHCENSCNN